MNNVLAAIRHRAALFIIALVCLGVCASVAAAPQQASQPTPQRDFGDYVPASQLPATEQIPAARLLIGAYSFVIVVLFLYIVSVSRRLGTVQREVERLEADVKRTSRA
jgi:CcmD family protein